MALSVLATPFRLSNASLPPQIVLLCRLMALALLATGHMRQLQSPFLPFIPGMDEWMPGEWFRAGLQALLIVSALGVLFTTRVRLFAAILGAVLLTAVVASRTYYGNNKLFTGLLLVLSALSEKNGPPRLLHWQFGLLYLGAGLNKLMDADWLSGRFFEHWAGERLQNPLYLSVSNALPELAAGKLFGWYTIGMELALAVCAVVPRLHPAALWGSGLFQCGLLLFTGDPFNLFFYATQAGLLAFVRWPEKPFTVIWDGSCGFCAASKRWMEKFDFDALLDWRTLQSGAGEKFGLSVAQLKASMYAAGEGWLLDGYSAWRRMVCHLPVFWYAACLAIAFVPGAAGRRTITALALLFLTPLSNPAGNAVYRLIARHRHRLLPGETCEVESKSPDPT